MRVLVTGGMGFIGSNFIRHCLSGREDTYVVNVDNLSYGSNLANLSALSDSGQYRFVKGDINDHSLINELSEGIDILVNFAAETHVDRSISNPRLFHHANTAGVLILLETCRLHDLTFMQVSTDEVYGSATDEKAFVEQDRLDPSSPYSASKGAGDLFVNAYHKTYGIRTFITRSTNNFGPFQFPEKFIPKAIVRAHLNLPVPIYGSGHQVRDWIYVEDHCEGLKLTLDHGRPGETYNIAGGNKIENCELVRKILQIMDKPASLQQHVEDRPGHNFRYSLDSSKITQELGWKPRHQFPEALKQTIGWYLENQSWWRPLIDDRVLSSTPWKEKW